MTAELEPIRLLDFIPQASPRLQSPTNLARIADAFERAWKGPTAVFATTPPQVGKTTLIAHGIAETLLVWPQTRVGYVSHSARYAKKRSREIKAVYRACGGVVPKGDDRADEWRTGVEGGGLLCGGVDGTFTGESLDLVIVDDPIKGRAEAESGTEREHLWDVFTDTIERRFQPWTSIIVIHTRWVPDDLGGRLAAGHCHPMTGQPYEHIRLPALDANDVSLHPQRFSSEVYRRMRDRTAPYSWSSLYMGQPFTKGGRAFEGAEFYDSLPAKLRLSLGLDMAGSAKTSSDWSVLMLLGVDDSEDPPVFYILDVIRKQEKVPAFAARVLEVQKRREWAGVEACWYYAGMEIGIIDLLRELGLEIDARQAAAEKFIRAQPVAHAWNQKRVRIPRHSESKAWVDDFVAELAAFTGLHDLHDDQVDALAAAFDAAAQSSWEVAMERLKKTGSGWLR